MFSLHHFIVSLSKRSGLMTTNVAVDYFKYHLWTNQVPGFKYNNPSVRLFLIWTIAANFSFIFDLFKEHEKNLQQMMLKKYPSTIVPNTSHQYIF